MQSVVLTATLAPINGQEARVTKPTRTVTKGAGRLASPGATPSRRVQHGTIWPTPSWILLFLWFAAASAALWFDGALFGESSQLRAVVAISTVWLLTVSTRWDAIWSLLRTRLGLLATLNGVVLVVSALFSVYQWASVREILKAAAIAEVFLLAAATVNDDRLREKWIWCLYWWSVAAAAVGSALYLVGMRWPESGIGAFAVQALATVANRLSSYFGYANATAAFMLLPIALGIAAACSGGRRGAAALAGLTVPLAAMQLTASRGGYLVLGAVLAMLFVAALRLAGRRVVVRSRAALVTGAVLVTGAAIVVVVVLVFSPSLLTTTSVAQVGQRFASIGAEVRNTDAETSGISGRVAMIRDSVRYAAAYPVLGSGPGTYASAYFRFRSTNFFSSDPHSLALLLLTETGTIGFMFQMLLLAGSLWILWRAAVRDVRRNPIFVGMAAGVTGVILHAMIDWDFQSWFLPLLVSAAAGVGAAALPAGSTWLLSPVRARLAPAPQGLKVGADRPLRTLRFAVLVLAVVFVCVTVPAIVAGIVAKRGLSALPTKPIEAARLLRVAGQLNPINATYPYLRAQAFASSTTTTDPSGTDRAVREGYARAIELNPYYIEYQIEQGKYLLGQMDPACVGVYENLTRIDPGDPGTFTSLGWAYHLMYRNDEKALASIDTALRIDSEYYEAWLVLGRIREASGDTASAIEAYWKAAQVNPADPLPLGRLGNLYEQAGNGAGTARVAWELLRQSPDSETAKTTFQSVGMDLQLADAQVKSRQLSASWTVGGKDAAESYKLVLVRAGGTETVLAEGIDATQREVDVTIPASIDAGTYRLRVYAMAPRALEALDAPWVSWAESVDLTVPEA
jgi:O-antigen ligase/tetratricopeptide (TPR) repeat protein